MEISEIMIIEHLDYIKKSSENLKGVSIKHISGAKNDAPWIYSSLCGEVDVLIKEYNLMVPHVNKLFENMGLSLIMPESKLLDASFKKMKDENTYPTIDNKLIYISLSCNKILAVLKNTATSTRDIKNRFDSLKKEIIDLEKEGDF